MNLQYGHFDVTHVIVKRLTLLLLNEEEKVRASLRPLAALELGHELPFKFFKGVD